MSNGELGGIFYRWEWYISTAIFGLPETHTDQQSKDMSPDLALSFHHM
jgi:hypothetical protein